MQPLNKLNKNNFKKKTSGPAVKKESHKSDVSSAEKKTKNQKVVGKIEPLNKKKSAPIIKGNPTKNSVQSVAAKKQPAKGKTAEKAVQQSKKNEAALAKTKQAKNPVLPVAAKKPPAKGKTTGKAAQQSRKSEAPIVKTKQAKNPVLPVAVKKQPAKGKTTGKTAQQSRKNETPIVKTIPAKNPVLPVATKKQPAKGKTTGITAQQSQKNEASKVKTKPAKNPVLPVVVKEPSAKGKTAGKAEILGEKKPAPVVKEKTSETKAISFEMDQVTEKKDVPSAEKIQTQNAMVLSGDLGKRYKCYKCGTKFYDLGKLQPLCPSCGANQLDAVIKATRKRRGKQRSAFVAKTEPHNIAPDENEGLHEVADELDSEFVLDMDDIVLEEHEDAEDKE